MRRRGGSLYVCVRRFFRTLVILIWTAGAVLVLTCVDIGLHGYRQQSERADVVCLFGAAVWGNGLTSCLTVSSPFHMERIMVLARLDGLQAFTSPPAETPASLSVPQRTRATAREELDLFKDLLVFAVSPD